MLAESASISGASTRSAQAVTVGLLAARRKRASLRRASHTLRHSRCPTNGEIRMVVSCALDAPSGAAQSGFWIAQQTFRPSTFNAAIHSADIRPTVSLQRPALQSLCAVQRGDHIKPSAGPIRRFTRDPATSRMSNSGSLTASTTAVTSVQRHQAPPLAQQHANFLIKPRAGRQCWMMKQT
jgi:hypothetical protein